MKEAVMKDISECEKKEIIRKVRQSIVYSVDHHNVLLDLLRKWAPSYKSMHCFIPLVSIFFILMNVENGNYGKLILPSIVFGFIACYILYFLPILYLCWSSETNLVDNPTRFAWESYYCDQSGRKISLSPLKGESSLIEDTYDVLLLRKGAKELKPHRFVKWLFKEVSQELYTQSVIDSNV